MLTYKKQYSIRRTIFLTGFLMLITANLSAVVFETKPYLQNPSSDGMTVMWKTSSNCLSWVEYGESSTNLTNKAEATSCGLKQAYNSLNKIRLTGLTPGMTYYYRVCSQEITDFQPYNVTFGSTIYSDVFSFRTPELNETTTKMVILNDIHNTIGSFEILLGKVKPTDYDFAFLNGDMVNDLKDEDRIITGMIKPCTDNFATTKPFMSCIGNHEKRGASARSFCDYISLPDDENAYYTFTRGPVYFIVLDTGEDKEDNAGAYFGLADFDAYIQKEAIWLEKQLNSDACKAAKYKIVLMHIPPFYSGCYGSARCGEFFNPIFNQYNIDLVIAGHTHVKGLHRATASTDHKYPILIGGGKAAGTRSIIKLTATESLLTAELINDIGMTDATYQAAPKTTSLQSEKSLSLKVKTVDNKVLKIEGLLQGKEYKVRIFSFLGELLIEENISPAGTINISDLSSRNYLISVFENNTGTLLGNTKFIKY